MIASNLESQLFNCIQTSKVVLLEFTLYHNSITTFCHSRYEEFHRKTRYIHFAQFEIFEI